LSGLHAARRDGVGMDCDVSLYDTAISLLNYPAAWHLNEGFTPTRTAHSAHPSLVPFQAFEAVDGWLIIGCAKEKFWTRLVDVLDHAEWGDDARFRTFADRRVHKDELIPMIEAVLAKRTVEDWLADLYASGIPCAPINDVEQALKDEHTIARGLIVETEHPRFGTISQVASPVRVGNDVPTYRRAPLRNEDMGYVLSEIASYDEATIARLASDGAFGDEHRHTPDSPAYEVQGAAR
jgi:crotonobetainyl-CoA:carnitine CoA-transferase CaiB-like acyl-CoA transferase